MSAGGSKALAQHARTCGGGAGAGSSVPPADPTTRVGVAPPSGAAHTRGYAAKNFYLQNVRYLLHKIVIGVNYPKC
jgi:hypothetical protein